MYFFSSSESEVEQKKKRKKKKKKAASESESDGEKTKKSVKKVINIFIIAHLLYSFGMFVHFSVR